MYFMLQITINAFVRPSFIRHWYHLHQPPLFIIKKKKSVTQSRTGLQIYEGHDDQLNRPGPMA
jgi:hypothetical protein